MQPSCKKHKTLLHLWKMTHNSALDASPPKASRLPEVMLSSMDLLAKKHTKDTSQVRIKNCCMSRCGQIVPFFSSQKHTHRTGCPWVSLHPASFPLLAILP